MASFRLAYKEVTLRSDECCEDRELVLGARPKGLEVKRKIQDANLNPDFLI